MRKKIFSFRALNLILPGLLMVVAVIGFLENSRPLNAAKKLYDDTILFGSGPTTTPTPSATSTPVPTSTATAKTSATATDTLTPRSGATLTSSRTGTATATATQTLTLTETVTISPTPRIIEVEEFEAAVPVFTDAGTTLVYKLTSYAEEINITVYSPSGKLIWALDNAPLGSGYHEIWWDGKDFLGQDAASGVYLAVLQAKRNDVHLEASTEIKVKRNLGF